MPLVAGLRPTPTQARSVLRPEPSHQDRTASWDTTTPRASSNSSTSRKDNGKRWYSHTAREMTSTGNQKPLYDTTAPASTASPSQTINKPDDHPRPKTASPSLTTPLRVYWCAPRLRPCPWSRWILTVGVRA